MSPMSNGSSTYSYAATNAVVPGVKRVAFCCGYVDHDHCYTRYR
jgi:hypothetical protein